MYVLEGDAEVVVTFEGEEGTNSGRLDRPQLLKPTCKDRVHRAYEARHTPELDCTAYSVWR